MKTIIIDGVEYNLTPKVQFKNSDWVVCKNGSHKVFQVIERSWPDAKYLDEKGNERFLNVFTLDEQYRPWTIQDAKDGDVLAAHECYVIFKEIDGLNIKCYCTYHYMGFNPSFRVDTLQNKTAFYPATKEQREQLEKAMADAGYEWDAEKKELKKIERKKDMHDELTAFESSLKHIIEEAIECGDTHNLKADTDMLLRLVQKPAAWSEEDEDILNTIINHFKVDIECTDEDDTVRWLKSLKERVGCEMNCTTTREWSEEDEQILSGIIGYLCTHDSCELEGFDKWYDWLKSLKDRYTWKPSDEQIACLHDAVARYNQEGFSAATLTSLLEQLKKLREE